MFLSSSLARHSLELDIRQLLKMKIIAAFVDLDHLHRGNPYMRMFFMVVVTNTMDQEGVGHNVYFCIEATNRLAVVQ